LVAVVALPKAVLGLVAGVVVKQARGVVLQIRVAPDTYLAIAHTGQQRVRAAMAVVAFKALRV
jgi:hypothetical protein